MLEYAFSFWFGYKVLMVIHYFFLSFHHLILKNKEQEQQTFFIAIKCFDIPQVWEELTDASLLCIGLVEGKTDLERKIQIW